MSKKKQVKKSVPVNSFLDNVQTYQKYLALIILMLIPILSFMSPYIFDGKEPAGSDVIGSKGNTHLMKLYEEESGEDALWNPSIFSGMPFYNRISPMTIHVDSFISILSKIVYQFFWYFILGGIGLFLFLQQKKIPWYISIIIAVAFIMLPDWQAMIGNGHFSKIRAIMVLPWLLFTFDYFIEKRSWLSTGLFALAFSLLVRTHHFQIVFYGILILFFLYVYDFIKLLIEKHYKELGGLVLKLVIAIVLTVMTSAQPMLSTYEYAEYSTRGGNPVKLGDEAKSAQRSGGVSFEYATRWSLAPREIIDFFIPRFTGGTSAEIYDGDEYPDLKGRQIPGYWGQMPFTDNYDAMGMILFLFALFGFIQNRKNKFVTALGIFIVFSVLLALGRHLPFLYSIFYEYVPFFSKFRVPVMFAHITFIATFILAGFGLKSLFEDIKEKDYKTLFYVFGGGIAFLVLMLLMKGSFDYLGSNEAGRYNPQTLEIIKNIRIEALTTDTIRVLILVALTTAVIAGFVFKKIKKEAAIILTMLLIFIEIFAITNRQVSKIETINPSEIEQSIFQQTEITSYLSKQNSQMRAIALGGEFQSNYYAYFYPTINGYSAIKLQLIQDINEHNLLEGNGSGGINWNVINMLNGKYIISSSPLPEPFLRKAAESTARKEILYENKNVQPKAWFVKEVKSFETREELVLFMNQPQFRPDSLALVVNKNSVPETFSADGTIEVKTYTPNEIVIDIKTGSPQFMVLSEVYYPAGWKAFIGDEELEIIKTNHILRGIRVPAGNSTLTFTFEPGTYYTSITTVWVGNIIILGLIGFGIFNYRRNSD
ncbi:MAG: hypothetical protein K9J16_11085 [Melioribacteraceae bacterium]|nr:hypothetical protein [Melioribacteraceae bacterium]MCF8355564.1 hypothetical protein [Melioribacteraceae bacterium]MCF8394239.1 hypothetical protein [Melioribacteraceae bacterium]MCF8419960.1 hypothetical protein [Melioribacteraceae bacterium]